MRLRTFRFSTEHAYVLRWTPDLIRFCSADGGAAAGAGETGGGGAGQTQTAGGQQQTTQTAGAGQTTQQQTTQQQTQQQATTVKDWREDLPEDLRGDAANFKHPSDAVKSASELRKKLSNSIPKLGENATAEEKAAHRKATGVPEAPEGYELKVPEKYPADLDRKASEASLSRIAKKAHEQGIPAAHVKALVDAYFEDALSLSGEAEDATRAAAATAQRNAEASLKKAWGGEYAGKLALATRVIKDYGGPDLAKYLETTGLGNSVAIANALADLGRYRSEDTMIGGGLNEQEATSLEAEHKALMDKPDYYSNAAHQRRAREIMEKLHGAAPIVGAAGRTL